MSGFDSVGKFYSLPGFVKQLGPWICCAFHLQPQLIAQWLQGSDKPLVCFLSNLKHSACSLF